MSCDDVAIQACNISKCFAIYDSPRDRLKQFMVPRTRQLLGLTPKQYYREFWALKDVSLEVNKGETMGVVGRNGSGKSTLLQIICGTLHPSSGTIETRGRIAALLELGAGFNPEFTGRENVYLNGSLLGLSMSEIENRFDQIAAFADIGNFIDQPIKTYSSGMTVRLAFAVSASIDPDILVIDEALAVGDIRFQAKCFNRLKQLQNSGTAILFVSHSTDQIVKHCKNALLLDRGTMIEVGKPKAITNRYMDLLYGVESKSTAATDNTIGPADIVHAEQIISVHSDRTPFLPDAIDRFAERPGYNPAEYRWGQGGARILDFRLFDKGTQDTVQLYADEEYTLHAKIYLDEIKNPVFGFYIKTIDGLLITGANSRDYAVDRSTCELTFNAGQLYVVSFSLFPRLASGEYMISIGVAEDFEGELSPLDRRYDSILIHVINRQPYFGLVDLGSRCSVKSLSQ